MITSNHRWPLWDDEYNDPIKNGHNQTAACAAFSILRNWDRFRRDGRFVVWLCGPPGRGKTMLARIMTTYYCILRDVDGLYMDWASTIQTIKDSWQAPNDQETMAPYYNADALIIDDVGKSHTMWEIKQLWGLIQGRQGKGITIITCNHSLSRAPGVKGDIVDQENNVVYKPFPYVLRNPANPKDATDSSYTSTVEGLLDRLRAGGNSFVWAEMLVSAPNSYRGRRAYESN